VTEAAHVEHCARILAELLEEKSQSIACLILEPLLQAAGGMIVYPAEYLRKARELCTRHDVLLIADEVMTGFGRTGKMFALRFGGRGAGPDVPFEGNHWRIFADGRDGLYGSSRGCVSKRRPDAHLLSRTFVHGECAGVRGGECESANFEDEPVFDRIAAIAKINAERLARFSDFAVVGETRQIGTMGAIELRADDCRLSFGDAAEVVSIFSGARRAVASVGKCSVCAAAVCDYGR